jgi:hypothetical protein
MAYNYPYYQQPSYQQPNYQQPSYQQPQQIQNGGLVSVRNEAEARNYPIAIGTSLTFKDENAPFVYAKTMGFSQLEPPKFEKYRLVKEEAEESMTDNQKGDFEALRGEIDALWKAVDDLKATKKPTRKKEISDDDTE